MSSPSSRSKRRTPQKAQSQRATTTSSAASVSTVATRRPSLARVVAPVDYSKDYADVRGDLLRIAIVTVLLLCVMVGISFFL